MIVGIDPGFSGAIACIDESGQRQPVVYDMPIIGEKKDKLVDGRMIWEWLTEWKPDLIVLERVGAMPGQGVVSMFNFGISYGTVLGLATASTGRVYPVGPAVWKKKYDLLRKQKSASIREAYLRFPQMRQHLTRKKDDGRAEALLLADYGANFV